MWNYTICKLRFDLYWKSPACTLVAAPVAMECRAQPETLHQEKRKFISPVFPDRFPGQPPRADDEHKRRVQASGTVDRWSHRVAAMILPLHKRLYLCVCV